MVLRIFTIVFPIFMLVAVGYLYGRKRRPDMEITNRLNMELFLPALILSALAGKNFDLLQYLPLALGCLVVVVGSGILCWPFVGLSGCQAKTLLPSVMFNNVGNMGLPLMLLTFGDQALSAAIVLMLVVTVLQFSLGVWVYSGTFNWQMLWRQPALLAALVGIGISLGGLTLWPPLGVAVKMLGDITLGLMIFSLGVRLSMARLNAVRIGFIGAVATPLSGMLVAWAYGTVSGLGPQEQDMLFIFGALPPAVSNFIFAEHYRQEPDKVASIVLIGNALAIVFVPFALALRL